MSSLWIQATLPVRVMGYTSSFLLFLLLMSPRGETWAMAQVPVASKTHDTEELSVPQTAPTRPTVSRWCAWSQIGNNPGIGC